jgi:hypothetical protein
MKKQSPAVQVVYRISDSGYNKVKPSYINNEYCLRNAFEYIGVPENDILVIADNCSKETKEMIYQYIPESQVKHVSVGHGAGTFNIALDYALSLQDDALVYFLENDYLHRPNSYNVLLEGFNLGAKYITLYLHPDKFTAPSRGGNPFVEEDGGYLTKIYQGEMCWWMMVDSTTMTFASKVKTLKEDESILREYTKGSYPKDFEMFLKLREKGRSLLCPIPSYSSHMETKWLAKGNEEKDLEDYWEKFI